MRPEVTHAYKALLGELEADRLPLRPSELAAAEAWTLTWVVARSRRHLRFEKGCGGRRFSC